MNMGNYDTGILKNNIKKLMEERNITQNELAENIGCAQSRISYLLTQKGEPTITQLVDIAKYFKVSVDELLGLNEEKEALKFDTLSDIANALFTISDSCTSLSFKSIEVPYIYTYGNGETEERKKARTAIYFDVEPIDHFIEEWKIMVQDIEKITLRDKVYNSWKREELNVLSKNKCEYKYSTALEYVKPFYEKLYHSWAHHLSTGFVFPDELMALKEVQELYNQNALGLNDWFENIEYINEVVNYCTSFKLAPGLPFDN